MTKEDLIDYIRYEMQQFQADLRAKQVKVLASMTPPVTVDDNTPIKMTVNKDGTVVLIVG